MQSTRGCDTSIELDVRPLLHAEGLRYRIDLAPGPGLKRRANIVFTRAKLAVFLDGYFWHACPKGHSRRSTSTTGALSFLRMLLATVIPTRGYARTVIRFWEQECSEVIASEIVIAY